MLEPGLDLASYAAIAVIMVFAYTVFGLTGFGSAMIGTPLLVQMVPLSFAVPLIVMTDLVSTLLIGWRSRRSFDHAEFSRLALPMLAGIAIGVTVLAAFDARTLLFGLGVFVLGNAAWLFKSRFAAQTTIRPLWALPAGIVGGMFSATFGIGGPVYTIYLARRLHDPDRFRATMVAVIFMSGILRLSAFLVAGLYNKQLLFAVAAALPFSLAGTLVGSRLRSRFDAGVLKKFVLILLMIGGTLVLARALST